MYPVMYITPLLELIYLEAKVTTWKGYHGMVLSRGDEPAAIKTLQRAMPKKCHFHYVKFSRVCMGLHWLKKQACLLISFRWAVQRRTVCKTAGWYRSSKSPLFRWYGMLKSCRFGIQLQQSVARCRGLRKYKLIVPLLQSQTGRKVIQSVPLRPTILGVLTRNHKAMCEKYLQRCSRQVTIASLEKFRMAQQLQNV